MKGILQHIRITKVGSLDCLRIIKKNCDMLQEVSKNTKYSHYPLMTTLYIMQHPNRMSLAGNGKLQALIGFVPVQQFVKPKYSVFMRQI